MARHFVSVLVLKQSWAVRIDWSSSSHFAACAMADGGRGANKLGGGLSVLSNCGTNLGRPSSSRRTSKRSGPPTLIAGGGGASVLSCSRPVGRLRVWRLPARAAAARCPWRPAPAAPRRPRGRALVAPRPAPRPARARRPRGAPPPSAPPRGARSSVAASGWRRRRRRGFRPAAPPGAAARAGSGARGSVGRARSGSGAAGAVRGCARRLRPRPARRGRRGRLPGLQRLEQRLPARRARRAPSARSAWRLTGFSARQRPPWPSARAPGACPRRGPRWRRRRFCFFKRLERRGLGAPLRPLWRNLMCVELIFAAARGRPAGCPAASEAGRRRQIARRGVGGAGRERVGARSHPQHPSAAGQPGGHRRGAQTPSVGV